MLSIAVGHDVGYLTGPVAGGRESYYTGAVAAGEPAGLWYGRGAEGLGLAGEVDADLLEAVYTHLLNPRDPAAQSRSTWGEAAALAPGHRNYRSADDVYAELLAANPDAGPEARAALRVQAEGSARQAVSFLDLTFSAQKSVTVLAVAFERAANEARAAGDHLAADAWSAHQRAVEDAVLAGAREAIDYLQDVAGYARAGHHGGGAGRWVDAHDWAVAQFLQHDSRNRDPQLHVHQGVLNRVLCADGVWRTLDSRAIHNHRGAAGAIAERVAEAHMTRSLGVRFETRPDGRAREIVGIDQDVLDLFSSRRRAISAKAEELCRAFAARHGRDPSPLERTRIAQQATLATRAAKSHDSEDLDARLERWERECREARDSGLADVAQGVFARGQQIEPPATWSERDVIERALAALGESRASWSRSDCVRALSDALPGHLGLDPHQVLPLLNGLTDRFLGSAVRLDTPESAEGLPGHLLRADGESVYAQPGAARYASPETLAAERVLRAAATERGAAALSPADADAVLARYTDNGRPLGPDQAAAVHGVLTSGAGLEVLSAAAGTGKSFTIGALADAWTEVGRRVVGLAPSQVAAEVLAEEGLSSANVASWIGAQRRLATPGRPVADSDERWRLRAGDLVVVDEAGMTSTRDLVEVHRRASAAGAKVLLVGDSRQLAAVGPGGALADVAGHGIRYELAEVRRFATEWERPASLRLRDGDPTVLDEYAKYGRLVDAGTAEQAEAGAARAWLADTLAGRESLLLLGSNEAAARTCAALRAELVALGRVDEHGVALAAQGTVAGVGDRVQARRNGWELVGHDGNARAPINRETYTVTGTTADGGLHVVDTAGVPIALPADYVRDHLALAYASTVHAAQGRTVDTSHAVLGSSSSSDVAYVALTRGRDRNTAHVVTRALAADAETGQTHEIAPRSARAVLADVRTGPDRDADLTATALAEQQAEAARSVQVALDRLAAEVAEVTAGRVGAELDRLAATGVLRPADRTALAADPAYSGLERLLRTAEVAGHDPAAVLHDAVAGRDFTDARSPAQVLHKRITTALDRRLAPQLSSYADLIPAGLPDTVQKRLTTLAEAADSRRRELGERVAADPPQWAREALGLVPDEPIARAEWEQRASWAAAYRELTGHDRDADPLGAAPPARLAENHAAWHAAHDALDLPDAGADEGKLTEGRLRARVRAYEREETWAPRYVADDLAAVEQRVERARADAELWTARAAAAGDPAEAVQLRAAAEQARAVAADAARMVADLEAADDARTGWWLHTAVTRDNAERARAELGNRGVDLDDRADQVTAEEWLDAHRADQAAEEPHREVTETDVADAARGTFAEAVPDPDLREISTTDATEHTDPDRGHVLTSDEAALSVARAQTALAEIAARRAADEQREAAEQARRDELTHWAAEQDPAERDPVQRDAVNEDADDLDW
ncbi:MobF family relaxase [Pseudonocardia charpentierae]|uniref:MobF family relaxase n=1 Tax=Pseudonocardia charpentierae TaxID=3075545 RepID=A0ABU2N3P2_9PSEU|nr:MobF family relaxase [Pseudonocardia sp. DSM 45834]MDT0348133.1 MobF family relaxase [Pseudonocardia sp. DSM 45834]